MICSDEATLPPNGKTDFVTGTLYAGCEMIGVTAGEAGNPTTTVPRAIRQVFWRILIFYVGMMFFIGILIRYDDDRLLRKGSRTAKSPLTMALMDAHIAPAAHIINALIVISVISAGNSALYVGSRTMLYMAQSMKAPKIFARVDKRGVPWGGLLITNLGACLAFLGVSSSSGTVYQALITLSGVATFIVWACIQLVHIRFRQAYVAQGGSIADLPFRAMWYPYGAYAALIANVILVFFQGYTAFLSPFSVIDFVTNYILLPVFAILFFGYKWAYKTKFVPLMELDLQTGRRDPEVFEELEEQEDNDGEGEKRGIMNTITNSLNRIFVG